MKGGRMHPCRATVPPEPEWFLEESIAGESSAPWPEHWRLTLTAGRGSRRVTRLLKHIFKSKPPTRRMLNKRRSLNRKCPMRERA